MASNSGIRGCSNYSEEIGVYEPDAASCLEHCVARGGDACEYHGNCYVEFGDGCYVDGGITGWAASLLTATDSATPASAMTTNNAVRGCDNLVALDPVYKASASACLSYCNENSAAACEWFSGNGDCYAEFGDACYLESGHTNWYGAILHALPIPERRRPLGAGAGGMAILLTIRATARQISRLRKKR
jgi:hypothetical protein